MIPHIHIIPILEDNYAYLIEGIDKQCLIVDPGESGPVKTYLREKQLKAVAILNTHHHGDHTNGNADFDLPVIAPEAERSKIPAITASVKDGTVVEEAGITLRVIETPGHTKGHVVFYCPKTNALFSGDTLFSLGCGRLIEDTAEKMFESLQKLKMLPKETKIYCGHEYTQTNGEFAIYVDPHNLELKNRMEQVRVLRNEGKPSVPVTIESELKTNPFLKAKNAEQFLMLRKKKDQF